MTATRESRVPLHNLEAERAVLGGLILDTAVRTDLLPLLQADDFYKDGHRLIFRHVTRLHETDKSVDLLLLTDALRRAAELQAVGGAAALTQILDEASTSTATRSYAGVVRELAHRRELGRIALDLLGATENGAARPAVTLLEETAQALARLRGRTDAATGGAMPEDVSTLLATEFPPTPAIVGDGVLPRAGVAVLAGPPKRGKSLAATTLGIARHMQQSWLGFTTTPGVTLYVQAELPRPLLKERLAAQVAALAAPLPTGVFFTETTRTLRVDTPEGLAWLRGRIERVRPDLVILDPLAKLMEGDENSTRDMGRLVAALDSLVEAYDIAILLIHHTGKPRETERSGGERLRGSSALFAAVDSVLLLDRVDAERVRLTGELRHGAEFAPRVLRRTADLWLLPSGPPPELLKVAAIVHAMPMTWTFYVKAIQADCKMSERNAQRALSEAVLAKLIAKNENKLYTTTAIYRQHANGGEPSADA